MSPRSSSHTLSESHSISPSAFNSKLSNGQKQPHDDSDHDQDPDRETPEDLEREREGEIGGVEVEARVVFPEDTKGRPKRYSHDCECWWFHPVLLFFSLMGQCFFFLFFFFSFFIGCDFSLGSRDCTSR
jgi:hypothetical protein